MRSVMGNALSLLVAALFLPAQLLAFAHAHDDGDEVRGDGECAFCAIMNNPADAPPEIAGAGVGQQPECPASDGPETAVSREFTSNYFATAPPVCV